MIGKRIARRKLGVRRLRAPSHGLRKQILHVPQRLLLHPLRVRDEVPLLRVVAVRIVPSHRLPKSVVSHSGGGGRKDQAHGTLQFPGPALPRRFGHLVLLPIVVPQFTVVFRHPLKALADLVERAKPCSPVVRCLAVVEPQRLTHVRCVRDRVRPPVLRVENEVVYKVPVELGFHTRRLS